MKTLIVATIATLLAVAALDLVGGSLARQIMAHRKLAHARTFDGRHGKVRKGGKETDDHGESYNTYDLVNDMEALSRKCAADHGATNEDIEMYLNRETELENLKCVAGCYYEVYNFNYKGELNKDMFAVPLMFATGMDDDYAYKAADKCEDDLAQVPEDLCERGWAIDLCYAKAAVVREVA